MTSPQARVVLASVSPRRRQLLTEAGFEHLAISPGIDDGLLQPSVGLAPHWWTASLAYLKARSAHNRLTPAPENTDIVLAADTIVVKGAQIIGQPRDAQDARSILLRLASGSHRVTSGVCLLLHGRRWILTDTADVRVGELTETMIEEYLASGDWKGKAGAYNLEERIRAGWPVSYDGDPTTIMGLPMRKLAPRLRRLIDEAPTGVAP